MIVNHIASAVASVDGVDPNDLEPLHEYMDTDVLLRLSEQEELKWSLTFQYIDHQVTVNHEMKVLIDGRAYSSESPSK